MSYPRYYRNGAGLEELMRNVLQDALKTTSYKKVQAILAGRGQKRNENDQIRQRLEDELLIEWKDVTPYNGEEDDFQGEGETDAIETADDINDAEAGTYFFAARLYMTNRFSHCSKLPRYHVCLDCGGSFDVSEGYDGNGPSSGCLRHRSSSKFAISISPNVY